MAEPEPVPGFLGRVLTEEGAPEATCFFVARGVVVTAWHVLEGLAAAEVGAVVTIDSLSGDGAPFAATVQALDATHDLAVLVASAPNELGGMAVDLSPTDGVEEGVQVGLVGVAELEDPGLTYRRHVRAVGKWQGPEHRDDEVPLGVMAASSVAPGMSGAPVCLAGSSTVVGVVSGRYNSLDGWFRDAVWVARVEDLEPLLSGVAQVTVAWPSAGESLPVRAVLEVDATRVRLRGGGTDVSGRHQGISFGLESAVNGFSRHRTNLVQWAEHRPGAVATTGVSELLAGRSCRTRWPRGWPGCWPGRNERISRSRSGCARRTVRPSHEC